jgi:hypothetical protein
LSHDPAKKRFFTLQLIRLSGAALAMTGLAALAGKTDLPWLAGAVLFVVGLFDLFVFPIILAKRWKSPPK